VSHREMAKESLENEDFAFNNAEDPRKKLETQKQHRPTMRVIG